MSSQLVATIDRPIKSAVLVNDCSCDAALHEGGSSSDAQALDPQVRAAMQESMDQLQHQLELFTQANETLNALTTRLKGYSSEMLGRHKEEIAQLSVEIARRVLAQRIENGDYDVEAIIKEAIGDNLIEGELSVHLNPEDLALLESARRESGQDGQPENVKLVADASVGRAECMVKTPKGTIESRIDQKLDQISGALKKAQ
jgi:flagellar biosynthesis/type III secretory pathway protein FliH